MKEVPILFSGAMVRALLSDQKTQTRRTIFTKTPTPGRGNLLRFDGETATFEDDIPDDPCPLETRCRFAPVGTRLWVRETWAAHWMYDDLPPSEARTTNLELRATDNRWFAADPEGTPGSGDGCPPRGCRGKWRPSIFLPRWACRLMLEVTQVRVERLQAITEADAKAEGVVPATRFPCRGYPSARAARVAVTETPIEAYARLWDEINGAGSWAKNPWVWAVSCKRVGGL